MGFWIDSFVRQGVGRWGITILIGGKLDACLFRDGSDEAITLIRTFAPVVFVTPPGKCGALGVRRVPHIALGYFRHPPPNSLWRVVSFSLGEVIGHFL